MLGFDDIQSIKSIVNTIKTAIDSDRDAYEQKKIITTIEKSLNEVNYMLKVLNDETRLKQTLKISNEDERRIKHEGLKHVATCPECTQKAVREIWTTLDEKKNIAAALCEDVECRKAISPAFTDDELKAIMAERSLKSE